MKKTGGIIALMFAVFLALSSCAAQPVDAVFCEEAPYCEYSEVVEAALSAYMVKSEPYVAFNEVAAGATVEAYDVQALPVLDLGLFWYPQYRATAVIAIDRDRTDVKISGWRDLVGVGEIVSLAEGVPLRGLLLSAISYGLEGENFTFDSTSRLLREIHEVGDLREEDYGAEIIICFDHQAAAMAAEGRNIEIIIPAEGTLAFDKGLLSSEEFSILSSDAALVAAGFRLPNGECDTKIYPAAEEYARAVTLTDYSHLTEVLQVVSREMRREVYHVRLFTSADGYEHQLFALIYIVLAIAWTSIIVRRAMQKGVRRSALICCALLVSWVLLRMFKYQLPYENMLTRYLWYGFYIFQIGIPLVLLWLAWVIDKPEDVVKPPRFWFIFAGLSGILLLLVFTNDLHRLVFEINISDSVWNRNYGYGVGYYLVLADIFAVGLLSQIIMVRKSWKNPRHLAFIFPALLYAFLIAYCVGYILQVPIVWESDITIMAGVFTLLFIETCIQSGLVPVNTKYRQFFKRSPQKMQITDAFGNLVLVSSATEPVNVETLKDFASNEGGVIPYGEDTLLYADRIPGGFVAWQEDVSAINRLHRETQASMERLAAANEILAGEEEIRGSLASSQAREALFSELEEEIREKSEQLSALLHNIPEDEEKRKSYMARVAMLVCYIKRRCNLFFLERGESEIAEAEFAVYMDELAEFAQLSGIKCLITCKIVGSVALRRATIMYDLFYSVLERMLESGDSVILVQITDEHAIKLMPSGEMMDFAPQGSLANEIIAADGAIAVKDLEHATGIQLTFSEGGGGYA